jgi:hypothetical protein
MAAFRSGFGCFALVTAVACGGRSVDELPGTDEGGSGPVAGSGGQAHGGSGQAGTAQGGSGQAGTAHGGSGQAGTAQGGTAYGGSGFGGTGQGGGFGGTGEGGSAGQCSVYADQDSRYVPVQIINKASKTIYLGKEMLGCEATETPPFQVQNATGNVLSPPSSCLNSCSASIAGISVGGCPDICFFPSAITLKPGEVFDTTWNGLFARRITLPPECRGRWPIDTCQQTFHAQPGRYTFSSVAGLDLDCSQTGGEPCSVCTPNRNGGCTTPSAIITGERLTASTLVNLDASYGIWSDGGAAGPSPGGNTGAAPAPRAVQIVFAD